MQAPEDGDTLLEIELSPLRLDQFVGLGARIEDQVLPLRRKLRGVEERERIRIGIEVPAHVCGFEVAGEDWPDLET